MRKGLRYDDMSGTEGLYLAKLIALFLKGDLTTPQLNELREWLEESTLHLEIFRYLTDPQFFIRGEQAQWN